MLFSSYMYFTFLLYVRLIREALSLLCILHIVFGVPGKRKNSLCCLEKVGVLDPNSVGQSFMGNGTVKDGPQ